MSASRSAAALGIARVEWLGYKDSGMTGMATKMMKKQIDAIEIARRI